MGSLGNHGLLDVFLIAEKGPSSKLPVSSNETSCEDLRCSYPNLLASYVWTSRV
jgi:hypothetical protein